MKKVIVTLLMMMPALFASSQLLTFNLWTRTIAKSALIATMDNLGMTELEIDSVVADMPAYVDFIIVNNQGQFQQYLEVEDGAFLRMADYAIDSQAGGTVVFSTSMNQLYANGNLLSDFSRTQIQDTELDIPQASKSILLGLCCKTCYAVHDHLDIEFIDCLCCLARCKSCFPPTFNLSYPNGL